MRKEEREWFQRMEAERGYLRARLHLRPTEEHGRQTPLTTGYRANWRFGADADGSTVQHGAPITIEGQDWLAPGDEAIVRLHPMFPEYWRGIEVGTSLTMLEGSRIVGTARVVGVVPPRSAMYTDPATAMDVKISPAARAFIHQQGGRLFIWTESFGRAWFRVNASPSPPRRAVEFDERVVAGVRLYLERGPFELRYFRIGLRRFPRRKLVVTTGMVVPPSGVAA